MRLTLLRCVQLILSAMDSDEVNSISDTTEAQQVVDILETTYYDLAATLDFPDAWDFFELEPSGDITRPTLMYLPDNIGKLEWVKYDCTEVSSTIRDLQVIKPMDRDLFFNRMNSLDSSHSDIYQFNLEVGTGTFDVRGYNDRNPGYYTTNDDKTLIFDNFDSEVSQTLVGTRTWCYGMLIPSFERDDDFVADFEPRQFSLYFNEAKSQAFADLKNVPNPKAEQRARRGWTHSKRKDPTVPAGRIYHDFTYDFGRKRQ